MLANPRIPLHRLLLSLSEALDHVHPQVADHQQRVAYIAAKIARHMHFPDGDLLDVFNAATLHDIGLISPEHRISALHLRELEKVQWHGRTGYELLKDNPLFERSADIIRHHHVPWADGAGAVADGCPVPFAAHIVVLADAVETSINRNIPVVLQADSIIEKISALAGQQFHPDCVDAFREVADCEAFWLDVTSQRIYGIILSDMDLPALTIEEATLSSIAEVFGRLVDAASPWTAVHSAGVTATAVALARRMDFSPRETYLMRAAGFLHDLGKLSVPTTILDKPGKLTREERQIVRAHAYHTFRILDTIGGMPQICEWAAFHHERLDGKGYPFRHPGEDLTLGSRIMAVADVFTALTEDRPYRPGMNLAETLAILNDMVTGNALDGQVVKLLKDDYSDINTERCATQAEYTTGQERILSIMAQSAA